jgi:hypothetical protein
MQESRGMGSLAIYCHSWYNQCGQKYSIGG